MNLKYLGRLIDEYKRGFNISKFNYFDASDYKKFIIWLEDLKLSSFRYRSFLESNDIINASSSLVEFGKGKYDTITDVRDRAVLITEYASSFSDIGKRLILDGSVSDIKDKVSIKLNNNMGTLTLHRPDIFLIQNPTENELELAYNLIRNNHFVCVGAHKNRYENNYKEELQKLNELKIACKNYLEMCEKTDLETRNTVVYTKRHN